MTSLLAKLWRFGMPRIAFEAAGVPPGGPERLRFIDR
jgi:hypothetical protein